MRFGKWIIQDNGIAWNTAGQNGYIIPREELTYIRRQIDGTRYYEWILSATDEEWLSQDDLFDLNFAFVYAAARFGLPFDYEVFDATLEEQYDRFDEEEEEEF
ncbi:MAG TPA: hypothetical protein VHK69_22640 [Chitinophagaceae bacterium]|nr:hypothetical protein [Chitinophagaceae bacterium]